uniref:hypothetical protein n=1 Tax=Cupriavidus gilardii TaxID=82541 RepID=UPI00247A2F9D|nr:hypothetical protein [Cupriavidus gilardii]
MKVTGFEQCVLGAWLSLAVSSAIMARSLTAGLFFVAIGSVFTAPLMALRGLNSSSRGRRLASKAILLVDGAVVLLTLLIAAERLLWVNSETYPKWLINKAYHARTEVPKRLNDVCGPAGGLLELREMDGGAMGRCGTFYFQGPVVRFDFDPLGGRQ